MEMNDLNIALVWSSNFEYIDFKDERLFTLDFGWTSEQCDLKWETSYGGAWSYFEIITGLNLI